MKFKKGQLVKWVEYRLHPRLRLRPRLRPRLRLRLLPRLPHADLPAAPRRGDLLFVCEAIPKSEAWERFDEFTTDEQKQIQNCYVVRQMTGKNKTDEKFLVYENEVEE